MKVTQLQLCASRTTPNDINSSAPLHWANAKTVRSDLELESRHQTAEVFTVYVSSASFSFIAAAIISLSEH